MEFSTLPGEIVRRNNLPNTERQDAVVHQTGATVAHSVPVRGATNTPTSTDRNSDASLCSADSCSDASTHHHAKSGQGTGDRVPGGGAAAVVSSFNQIQINRNKQLGRGKHCGRFTVRGTSPLSTATKYHRVNCKCWKCSFCGPKKAKRYRHAIRAAAEKHQLQRLITLTLDPKKIQGDPVRYVNGAFAKLRIYLQRQYGIAPQYIRVLEFQKNGNPHFHILIDRFIALEWIRKSWVKVGGGYMVNITFVDIHRVSNYVSKYLSKELLLSAPSRCRRVTTSRGIKLLEKAPTEIKWEFRKVPIFRLFELFGQGATEVMFDEDQVLVSFTTMGEGK